MRNVRVSDRDSQRGSFDNSHNHDDHSSRWAFGGDDLAAVGAAGDAGDCNDDSPQNPPARLSNCSDCAFHCIHSSHWAADNHCLQSHHTYHSPPDNNSAPL